MIHDFLSYYIGKPLISFSRSFRLATICSHSARRKRDIDNIQKSLLDALDTGGAFYNDCQIKHLTTVMRESVQGGKTVVCIKILKKTTADAEIK
jgi:Holliday junction resolvase RusA-like endonuclease